MEQSKEDCIEKSGTRNSLKKEKTFIVHIKRTFLL